LGTFELKPKRKLESKHDYIGLRGTASYTLQVPTKFEEFSLSKIGETKNGWTLRKLTPQYAELDCVAKTCMDTALEVYTSDQRKLLVMESSRGPRDQSSALKQIEDLKWETLPKNYTFKPVEPKGPFAAQLVFQGPAASVRGRRQVQSAKIDFTSKVVPSSFLESDIPGYLTYRIPQFREARLCNDLDPKASWPVKVTRPEGELGIRWSLDLPECLNASQARVFQALELSAGKRDLTGKFHELAGDNGRGRMEISVREDDFKWALQTRPLATEEDLNALRETLWLRGVINVSIPKLEITELPLDASNLKKLGLKIVPEGKMFSVGGKNARFEQMNFLAANGLELTSSQFKQMNDEISQIYPARPARVLIARPIGEQRAMIRVSEKLPAMPKPSEPGPSADEDAEPAAE
jgi:hypothetical protein